MIKGHFIESAQYRAFITQYGESRQQKNVLLLPSMFEEMNLCRAILAKQANFLTQHGYCVYALDYAGTGDSEGDINQVTAMDWQRNIIDAVSWLKAQGVSTLSIWGVRFGGLMAFQSVTAIQTLLPVDSMLLWKPVTKGKQFMTQFLRLKQANSMMQGQEKVNWRQHILDGNETEVAGYPINEALLHSIDGLEMPKQLDHNLPIHWMELSATKITPAINMQTKLWAEDRFQVTCFEGSAFWQIPEIFVQPALFEPTLKALEEHHES